MGYYIAGTIHALIWKEQMKEKILADMPESLLDRVTLSGNEQRIDWKEEGHEFSFEGKMYDVVDIKVIDGRQIIYCVADEHEDQLLEKINAATQANTQHENKHHLPPAIKIICEVPVMDTYQILHRLPVSTLHSQFTVTIPKPSRAIISPPPRPFL